MREHGKRNRVDHYLRKNHGTHVPRNWVFVETLAQAAAIAGTPKERLERLDMGVAHGARFEKDDWYRWQQLDFTQTQPFWGWLVRRIRSRSSLWVCGHGIAKSFTLLGGWQEIDRRTFRFQPRAMDNRSKPDDERVELETQRGWLVDGDPPTILQLYHDQGVIHLVDVQNYTASTVEELAAEVKISLPKKPGKSAGFAAWNHYLNLRCIAVRDWMKAFLTWWRQHELGQWRHTLASLSMAAYRHKFMDKKILVHTCEFALEKEREALCGGELRLFFCGRVRPLLHPDREVKVKTLLDRKPIATGPIHVYDVNSLYPYVMRERLYPRELIAWKRPGTLEDFERWRKTLLLIARVRLNTETESYPVYHESHRYYATGQFWTTLCGPELDRAVQLGHVEALDGLCAYAPGKLFVEFVNYFHRMRLLCVKEGEKLRSKQASLIMQSLAGKFGQKSPRWEFVDDQEALMRWGTWPVIDAQTKVIRIYRAIAGYVQEKQLAGEGLDSVPSLEAFVNCYGRDYMRTIRLAIGEENLLYQSTDALHVLDQGVANVQPWLATYPGEIGKFKHLGTYETGEYRGPHDYTLDGVHTIAGVKSDAEVQYDRRITQWESPRLASILQHEPNGFLRVKEITFEIGKFHPQGIWEKDGRVSPPTFVGGKLQYYHPTRLVPKVEPDDTRKSKP